MAIPATQMRPGMIIKHNDQLHLVFKVEHRTPGNLRAFIQAKLRNLRTGAMFEHRFRSADAIEKVVVDEILMEMKNLLNIARHQLNIFIRKHVPRCVLVFGRRGCALAFRKCE